MENLSDRKREILMSSIEDYIQDASPITSMGVQKKHLQNISSATLRNELSALEAMGYLKQLHTSGGRIPTSKAYRLFVNELMKDIKFSKKSLSMVKSIFTQRSASLTDIVNSIASVVSEATNYPAVILLNGYDHLVIENIKIIPLIDGSGIVLLGTKSGMINNTINFTSKVTEENCIDASNYLTNKFKGQTIASWISNIKNITAEISAELTEYEGIFNNLVDCLKSLSESKQNIYSSGMTKLLDMPDYKDVDSLKKVLNILENEEELQNVLNSDETDGDISFTIGTENKNEALEKCTVVRANYKINGENVASIGVIGPERMNYPKIANALKFIVDELSKINMLYEKEDDK